MTILGLRIEVIPLASTLWLSDEGSRKCITHVDETKVDNNIHNGPSAIVTNVDENEIDRC